MLLTVVIVGILAATMVPHFTDSTTDAQDAALRQSLHTIRSQIELFKAQHGGHLPGWTGPYDFGPHMMAYTNAAGDISLDPDPAYPLGPYLPSTLIVNPVNGGTSAKAVTGVPSGQTPQNDLVEDGERVGWFINVATGQIAPNAEGATSQGIPRIQL